MNRIKNLFGLCGILLLVLNKLYIDTYICNFSGKFMFKNLLVDSNRGVFRLKVFLFLYYILNKFTRSIDINGQYILYLFFFITYYIVHIMYYVFFYLVVLKFYRFVIFVKFVLFVIMYKGIWKDR